MKKTIVFLVIFIILGLALSIGYYVYKSPQLETNVQEAKKDMNLNTVKTSTETELKHISNEVIQTNASNEKVLPNATLIIKKYYKKCGHITKDYATIPEEIVNKTEAEIKDLYKKWEVQVFSPKEIVLYKEIEGICNEHYILKEKDGVIAIYTLDENNKEKFKEKTSISTKYLTEDDLNEIKQGIKATGKEELNSILEDYE